MIDFLHKFYVVERKAIEIAPLTFQRDDENAMCSFGKIMSIMRKNSEFMDMFSECVWNIDGEEEDIIAETLDYEKGIRGEPLPLPFLNPLPKTNCSILDSFRLRKGNEERRGS